MTPTQHTKGYVSVHSKTLERRGVGHILDNIFTFNRTEDRAERNRVIVEAILTNEITSDWKSGGIACEGLSVTSSRLTLDILFKLIHPQKGTLSCRINRKPDSTGMISIFSESASIGEVLPRDAEKAIKRLQEIIIEATSTQTTH